MLGTRGDQSHISSYSPSAAYMQWSLVFMDPVDRKYRGLELCSSLSGGNQNFSKGLGAGHEGGGRWTVPLQVSRCKCCGSGGSGGMVCPTDWSCVLGDCLAGLFCRNGPVPVPRCPLIQVNSSLVNISVPMECCFPVLPVAPEMLA